MKNILLINSQDHDTIKIRNLFKEHNLYIFNHKDEFKGLFKPDFILSDIKEKKKISNSFYFKNIEHIENIIMKKINS